MAENRQIEREKKQSKECTVLEDLHDPFRRISADPVIQETIQRSSPVQRKDRQKIEGRMEDSAKSDPWTERNQREKQQPGNGAADGTDRLFRTG